jgi:hypothetical protein
LIGNPNDPTALNRWSKLSEALGCGPVLEGDDMKNIGCLRRKSVGDVLSASRFSGIFGVPNFWKPQSDEKTVFSNYVARTSKGNFIKVVSFSLG